MKKKNKPKQQQKTTTDKQNTDRKTENLSPCCVLQIDMEVHIICMPADKEIITAIVPMLDHFAAQFPEVQGWNESVCCTRACVRVLT